MQIQDRKNLDPGCKNSDPGSRINIPDPQQLIAMFSICLAVWRCSDEHKRTPLHFSAAKGYTEVVDILLRYGADPNQKARDSFRFEKRRLWSLIGISVFHSYRGPGFVSYF